MDLGSFQPSECTGQTRGVHRERDAQILTQDTNAFVSDMNYGSAKTYSDSVLLGFGSVIAPPPDALTATYCLPSLPW